MVPEEGAVKGGVMLRVNGWRRHVLISGVWRLHISSIRQTGSCQRQRVNESKLPGKECKQTRPLLTDPSMYPIYPIGYYLCFVELHAVDHMDF